MKKTLLLFAGLSFLIFKNQAQTVTDIDNNVYDTIHIGAQVWLKQNLKVTHYNDGSAIPNVTGSQWNSLATGAYCYYDNNGGSNSIYGNLYNWFTVNDNRKLCPANWHVASNNEWDTLIMFLGGNFSSGGKLKEAGLVHWISPNTGATNESNFTAMPGGWRSITSGIYEEMGNKGYWWTSTVFNATLSNYKMLLDSSEGLGEGSVTKRYGLSVRCILDSVTSQINDKNIDPDSFRDMQIYPNPSIDRVFIDFAEIQKLNMQIYNMIGKCVLQSNLTSATHEINISSLKAGIYIIQLTGTDWTIQQKFIKK